MITAVGVVIPAHDEELVIGACLRSLAVALAELDRPVVVCVVADRCSDATVRVVRETMPSATVLENDDRLSLGEVRDLGVRAVLARLGDPESVWLLGTDADTQVPVDWARRQVAHADEGADAVTGLVELQPAAHLTAVLRERYARVVSAGIRPVSHDHVHGANFGVRGSAFLAVGGYRPIGTGEDRDLWFRLVAAGFAVRQPLDLTVRTSARVVGRAQGGLADLLAGLIAPGYRDASEPAS
ncbi:glycosyltransferase [Kribbella sp. NPDC051770]|uniref:glycosyltransferase n=1 Tax=Kribbella sp. NPDC051770 TaxID=3155413 RepID=UPI003447EC31